MKRARGRPRQYNEDDAIQAAGLLFWTKGFSATSLDDLAMAMDMTRPSIYNAFGNKNEIYRRALANFCGQLDAGLRETLHAAGDLRTGLMAFYDQAIEVYCGTKPPMGCLMVCTAPSESLAHPDIGKDLSNLIVRLDRGFAERLTRAKEEGELADSVCPKLAATLLQATLQTLALRARSGASKSSLRKLARYAVTTITAPSLQ